MKSATGSAPSSARERVHRAHLPARSFSVGHAALQAAGGWAHTTTAWRSAGDQWHTAPVDHMEAAVARVIGKLPKVAAHAKTRSELLAAVPAALTPGGKEQRRFAAAALRVGNTFVSKGRWGRAASSFLLALALNPDGFARAERAGLLAARDAVGQSRARLLTILLEMDRDFLRDLHPRLPERLETYVAVEQLAATLRRRHSSYVKRLQQGRLGLVKALLALVEASFLRVRLGDQSGGTDEDNPLLPLENQPRSAEDWASVASLCISDSVSLVSLPDREVDAEVASTIAQPDFLEIVDTAVLLFRIRRCVERVTTLGYTLERQKFQGRDIFTIRAPSSEFEKAYRNAGIRAHLAGLKRNPIFSGRAEQMVSMAAAAEYLVRKVPLHRIVHEPFRRFVVAAMDPSSGAYAELLRGRYFEDLVVWLEHADWGVTADDLLDCVIGETLTVREFFAAFRPIRIFFELHGAALCHAVAQRADDDALLNSCVPVLDDEELTRLIRPASLGSEKEGEFWKLLRWEQTGFLDVQYTPILRASKTNMVAPRVLLVSNLVRNLMALRKRRIADAGDTFGKLVAEALKAAGLPVATEQQLKSKGVAGEVDVIALAGETLILFECKHSLAGASVHEHSDAWSDVVHAGHQLEKCRRLIDELGLQKLAEKWFPGHPAPKFVQTVVLTSTRLFFGLDLNGVPVRDWQTLQNVLTSGIIEVASTVEDGALHGRRWSFWIGEHFSALDLLAYLSKDSVFVAAGELFLSPYTSIEIRGREDLPTLVRETFVANLPTDVDLYGKHLVALGLRDLGPWVTPIATLVDLDAAELESIRAKADQR